MTETPCGTPAPRGTAESESLRAADGAKSEEERAGRLWKKGEQSSGRPLEMQVAVRNALLAVMPNPTDRENFEKAFGDHFRNDHVFAAPAKRPTASSLWPTPPTA